MASKTLAGAAASFANRFFYPSISQKSNPNLFFQSSVNSPFLPKFQPWRCFQEEEAVNAIKRADFDGISYPCGIPSSFRLFIEDVRRPRVVGASLRGGWQKVEQKSLLNSLGWMSK